MNFIFSISVEGDLDKLELSMWSRAVSLATTRHCLISDISDKSATCPCDHDKYVRLLFLHLLNFIKSFLDLWPRESWTKLPRTQKQCEDLISISASNSY